MNKPLPKKHVVQANIKYWKLQVERFPDNLEAKQHLKKSERQLYELLRGSFRVIEGGRVE